MLEVTEAIILAGGKGTRLRSVTMNEYPKGLTLIQNRPILEWEVEWLAREGVESTIIAVGHLGEQIEAHFGHVFETKFGAVNIEYSYEKEKLGSGGAVKQAGKLVKSDRFFVLNGDVMCDVDTKRMRIIHEEKYAKATMLTIQMRSPYGNVESEDNMITSFVEKPLLPVYIHGGLDIIETEMLPQFPDHGQMEDTIFVQMAEHNQFASFSPEQPYFWHSIDTEKDYTECNENWLGI